MVGLTFIDNLDLYTQFGVIVASKDGYKEIVCYPPLKDPEINDWHEDDGIEVDLESPKLNTQNVDIQFYITDFSKIELFLAYLSDGAYHEFRFEEIKLTKTLRLVSHPNNKVLIKLASFSLQFADDFPLESFVADAPTPGTITSGFEIDGKDLQSYYGIIVLEGIEEELSKSSDIKENLIITSKAIDGLIYDDSDVKLQQKEVAVKCLYHQYLEANNRYWWQDYYNFLSELIQPDERIFYAEYQGNEHPCYYKSASVSKVAIVNDKIWIEFTVNLMLTAYKNEYEKVLASENGLIITMENDISIDLIF